MKKLIYISLVAAIAVGSGCKKGFLSDLQNNPNQPTTNAATPQLILPGAINSLVNITNGVGSSNGYQLQGAWLGYWNYSGGYSYNTGAHEYIMYNTGPEVWDGYYNVLSNLNVIKQQASASPTLVYYTDIANILGAICYKNLVDAYNDVPYSTALQGAANFYPTYDKGSDVYDSLVATLDAVMDNIHSAPAGAVAPSSDDVLFGGDMSQWLVFANTIKLKLLVQQSAVSSKSAYITAEAAKTSSYGYLTADAIVQPGYSSAKESAFYSNFGVSATGTENGTYSYIRGNGTAIAFYKNTHDPRLGYFYSIKGTSPTQDNYYTQSSSTDDYNGDVLGKQSLSLNASSGIGPGLIQNKQGNQGAVLMLAAESYFVQAEATVRGYLSGGATAAQALYDKGIEASFNYLGATGATAYENGDYDGVRWPADMNGEIAVILTQKWAALNGISNAEGWNDWRRTGYPAVPGTVDPNSVAKHMPYRYYYPLGEVNTNSASWKAAGGDKVDPFTSKIFWMPQ